MRSAALLLVLIIALVGASAAHAASGVVASWPFNEGSGPVVTDTSGHGNNGTISGDAQWVGGFSGSALSFDGGTGRVRVPDSPSLDPTASVSVAAWVRATEPQGDYNYILAKGASGCLAASYGLYTGPNGGLMFYVAQSRGQSYTRSPDGGSGVWNGSWHFVMGTYDGSSVRLYIDGGEVGIGTAHTGPIDYNFPDNDLFIGHYNRCPTEDFHGQVDEAQIWNRSLTASEVRSTYDQVVSAAGSGASTGTGPIGQSPTSSTPGASSPSSPGGSGPLSPRPHTGGQSGLSGVIASGLSSGKPHLVVQLSAPNRDPIKSFTVTLPGGLSFARSLTQVRRGLSLSRAPKYSLSRSAGQLIVVFKQPQRAVSLTIGGPALTESSGLIKRVRAVARFNRTKPPSKKKVVLLTLAVRMTDTTRKSSAVHAVFRV
jgi:hypothetical protein